MIAHPSFASFAASERATEYSGIFSVARAEPKKVTAGPTSASVSNPSTNSASILKSRHAEQILQQGEGREIEKFGEIAGMRFRAFADILSPNFVADLKSCQDASPEGFMRAAFNQDYHLQAAIYRELFGCPRFFWIAAESSSPWNVQIYEQSEEAALLSRDRLYRLIERFKDWDGQPEGYSSRILHLDLPRWAQ